MKLSQFKFKLPENLIAQYPAERRDECRLMVVHRKTGEIEHRVFKEILDYFGDGDVMVFNDTQVFPARLYGNKEKTGARIEVFLLRELNAEHKLWDVLVEPARKIRIGNKLYFGDTMISDDEIALEWTRIPHFYYNYYVFQYATSFSAAVAIANRILREGESAVRDYKKFLSGGCSKEPVELLRDMGVDMRTPAPVNDALSLFGELIDELSALLG